MTDYDDDQRMSHDEIMAEFAALFPQGWAGPDVFAELASDGWDKSPLVAVYHPSVEQVFEESVRMHENMANLPFARKPDAPPPPPPPTFEQTKAEYQETPVEPELECRELLGRCLWDIFSDNHDVIAADGRVLDLGSMRSGGGFLADVLNSQGGPPPPPKPDFLSEMVDKMFVNLGPEHAEMMAEMRKEMLGDGGYSYLDFYMGTSNVAGRADLRPVYRMIFRRLRARGMDWKYTFPRLYAVDFRPLKKMMDEQQKGDEPEFEGYDPSAAFEKEEKERERDEEVAKLRESLDEGHREAVEASQNQPPPATVQAYEVVYGRFPQGWPPEVS